MKTTDYCDYELSKALKAAGFDESCDHCYVVDKDTESNIEFTEYASRSKWNSAKIGGSKYPYKHISAPTLAYAQKWLREKWGIAVSVQAREIQGELWYSADIVTTKGFDELVDGGFDYLEYEAALSAGLNAALDLLAGKEGEG